MVVTRLRSTFWLQDQRAPSPFSIICAYEHQRALLFELAGVSIGQELTTEEFNKVWSIAGLDENGHNLVAEILA